MISTLTDRKKLCVFCGSSAGYGDAYKKMAIELGQLLAEMRVDLVYGGARVGLMGIIADSVLKNGGNVYGVIPRFMLEVELGHTGLTQLDLVDSMHERKQRMYDLSDAFLAIPGGIGTMDELFEILTWSQLERHSRPCGIFNFQNYYDNLLKQLQVMRGEGFWKERQENMLTVFESFQQIENFLMAIRRE